ncbi:MAG: hypothetical protein HY300_07635 [Verrucomicrobia bacterium]|nr:hypothetical protein [Verrucomicrobiota bacterium]
MKSTRPRGKLSAGVFIACVLLGRAGVNAADSPAKEVELRGRVVCLVEERAKAAKSVPPAKHEHVWGFKTGEGQLYTLLRTKNSEALFLDERLRQKDLVLKGPLKERTREFEPVVMRSVKNGVVHELYYWCDICTIRSIVPGECVCCRAPVELRERPLKQDEF